MAIETKLQYFLCDLKLA